MEGLRTSASGRVIHGIERDGKIDAWRASGLIWVRRPTVRVELGLQRLMVFLAVGPMA